MAKKQPDAHGDSIWALAWTSANKIVTASVDEHVKIWYVPPLHRFSLFHFPIQSVHVITPCRPLISLFSVDVKEPFAREARARLW